MLTEVTQTPCGRIEIREPLLRNDPGVTASTMQVIQLSLGNEDCIFVAPATALRLAHELREAAIEMEPELAGVNLQQAKQVTS